MRLFLHLREKRWRWVRIPIAILLLLGGVVGFLPILGFWMIPLALVLLAADLPFLRQWLRRVLRRISAWRTRVGNRGKPDSG